MSCDVPLAIRLITNRLYVTYALIDPRSTHLGICYASPSGSAGGGGGGGRVDIKKKV